MGRRRVAVAALAAVLIPALIPALIAALAAPSPAAQALVDAPQPYVEGNQLRDARSDAVWAPHGASVPGLEYACVQGWTPTESFSLASAQAMASWGMDVVRLPLNEDCWLGTDGAPTSGSGSAAQYKERIQQWVDWAHQARLAVIFDLHWTAPPGYRATGQQAMTDAQSVTFWSQLAAAYADDPSVMFELFNEPYSPAYHFGASDSVLDWDCLVDGGCRLSVKNQDQGPASGDAKFTVVGMAELLAAVRDAGAEQPVLLGGPNYANDLSQWLATTAGLRAVDGQLVAAWHNYRGQGCTTSCTGMYAAAEAVAAAVPLVITEFGYESDHADWFGSVMDWADAHGVGYLPWAWWDVDTDYALYTGSSFAPRPGQGTEFKSRLAALADEPDDSTLPSRIAGPDRYATAAAIAGVWDQFRDAELVFVATGENYPDALSAAAAAAHVGAPIVLTPKGALPSVVKSRLNALHPGRIVVLGSSAAVSTHVVNELKAVTGHPTVTRIQGADRYATGRAIIEYAWGVDGDGDQTEGVALDTVVIATGRNFPDALSAAPAVAHTGGAVVLVDGAASRVSSATLSLLRDLDPAHIVIAGSTAAVKAGIESQLRSYFGTGSVTRVKGADRYATAVALTDRFFDDAEAVFFAVGTTYPDALAGAALAGALDAPLIVTPKTCVSRSTRDLVTALGPAAKVLLGSSASISASVADLKTC